MKRNYLIGSMLLMGLLLAGCGKKEEEVKNQITIVSYDAANTASEYVKKGDLDTGETAFLTLESSETVEYFFEESGLLIEKVYVAEGDEVSKGTLMAEAENESIKLNLKKAETEVASVMENINHYTSLLNAEKEKNVEKEEDEIHNLDQISRYELKLAELNDNLIIAQKKTTEWGEQLAGTQIYAGMDGCVEYVGAHGNGVTSSEKMPFIKLGTSDQVFAGSIKGGATFEIGQKIELAIGESSYEASVISVEEAEGETQIRVTVDEYVDLTGVTFAEYMWNEEHLEDVLYVPTEAVVTVNGENFVYVYDEKGFPNPVKVTVGKMGTKYTSIKDGVGEGELVELF